MSILTVEIDDDILRYPSDLYGIMIEIKKITGVLDVHDDWPKQESIYSRCEKDKDAFLMTYLFKDGEEGMRIAVRTVVAWAGDRRGRWAITLPTKSVFDPHGQIGYVGWICGEDGELASECYDKMIEYCGQGIPCQND